MAASPPGEFSESPNVKPRATLSQAFESKGSKEGATTRSMSLNNNSIHEDPEFHYNETNT